MQIVVTVVPLGEFTLKSFRPPSATHNVLAAGSTPPPSCSTAVAQPADGLSRAKTRRVSPRSLTRRPAAPAGARASRGRAMKLRVSIGGTNQQVGIDSKQSLVALHGAVQGLTVSNID